MIGHFLLTLTPEEEDRVLTQPMRAEGFSRPTNPPIGCLVEVAWKNAYLYDSRLEPPSHTVHTLDCWVPGRYDDLCARFGEARVNTAIRHRILANRAARTLRTQEVLA